MRENTSEVVRDDLSREVYCVLGVPIDAIEMPAVLHSIHTAATKATPFLISTPNLNFLGNSQTDPEFRESILLSDLCPPDGMPVVWIAQLLGIPIKRRTAGSDIFEALKSQRKSGRHALKIFVFGSTEQVAAAACERLNCEPIGLKCVGWACPGFVDVEELSEDRFINRINESDADFLVAALGARKGQLWLQRNHDRLKVPIRAHLGATVNFQAGTVKRAPYAMQRVGLEWLWRIKEEPILFWRYWHDGKLLLRLLVERVLPLAFAAQLQQLRPNRGGQDFVTMEGQEDGTEVTLKISGDATAKLVPQAIDFFHDATASQKPVVIDLSRARTVDARFFRTAPHAKEATEGQGTCLRFVGVSPRLQRVFQRNSVGYLLSSGEKA